MSRLANLSAILVSGALAAPAFAAVFEQPPRKPGLWTMTNSFSGRTITSHMCLDATVDKKLSLMGQSMGKSCSVIEMNRLPNGIHFHSVCAGTMGGTSTTSGVIKGDFSSRYTMEADVTTAGATIPMLNKTMHMQIAASWTGPCDEGQKPGDMIMPNGMKINMVSGVH